MTIEEKCYLYGSCKCQNAGCVVRPDNGCPVYRYFKGIIVKDYENRLKGDMAAILDKIRAEIEQGYCTVNNDYDHGRNYGLYMATQIIDKYKGEEPEI